MQTQMHMESYRRRLRDGATPQTTDVYVDGAQAKEKRATAQMRESKRQNALNELTSNLDTFESRIESHSRIRKQSYIDLKKGFSSGFYWSLESRNDFVDYMRRQNWNVVFCETEADVQIARDAQPGDVIISRDSDFLGYASVFTIWRPVSKSLILVYKLPELLMSVGLTRTQLTALAVVSKNDYERNIHGLGPTTNYGVIKRITGLSDPRLIVAEYLLDGAVITKNTQEETFQDSIKVFVEMKQEQVDPLLSNPAQVVYGALQQRFRALCQKRESLKDASGVHVHARPADQQIVRLRLPRSFNRYRTIESPAIVAKDSEASPPQPADSGHPALARTRIPRHRERYSFQEQTRRKIHTPPPRMKQFSLKHYKEPSETTSDKSTPTKPKTKVEKISTPLKKPLANMEKIGLVRSLAWHHPTVSLEVGTLNANTKRVFMNQPLSTTPPSILAGPDAPSSTLPNLNSSDLQRLVMECLQVATCLAAEKKREAQRLIGVFVETLRIRMDAAEETLRVKMLSETPPLSEEQRIRARRDAITEVERKILDCFCDRIKLKDADTDVDGTDKSRESDSDLDGEAGDQEKFLLSFLTFLYSGNYPRERDFKGFGPRDLVTKDKDKDEDDDKTKKKKTSPGVIVNYLIDWLVGGHFYKPIRGRGEIDVEMLYTPTIVVRSVSGQLALELEKMYGHGSQALYKQVEIIKKKGVIGAGVDIRIQEDVSAVENFVYLNKLTNYSRRTIPFTTSQQPFICFSERELGMFMWKRDLLRQRLCGLAFQDDTQLSSISDLDSWISHKEPGFIIRNFICAVGSEGMTSRQRKKAGHRAAVKLRSLDDIRSHLELVKSPLLDVTNSQPDAPNDYSASAPNVTPAVTRYKEKGYILRGSIRTDGFRVQLVAFKLLGGTNYYLTEIRNIITCKEDLHKYWPGVPIERIKTLTMDAGQACLIGGFAHLPKATKGKEKATDSSPNDMEGVVGTLPQDSTLTAASTATNEQHKALRATTQDSSTTPTTQTSSTTTALGTPKPVFFNLAVKTKAVYQPTFRFRRWVENEKQRISDGEHESIQEIETRLPPLKGPDTSVMNYVKELERVEEQLKAFYNGQDHKYKKHQWDMSRARHMEYQLIADRLLKIVGGLGIRSDPLNPVIIGVGLGKFGSKSGLASLHSSFLSYFIPMARSLGYFVVGINEYYTSKKCPCCGLFVAQVNMRRFYCSHCQVYHHRDIMAAENMANIIQGYLRHQERPDYLHPVAADGSLPWKVRNGSSTTSSGSAAGSSANTATSTQRRRKRTATATSMDQERQPRALKK